MRLQHPNYIGRMFLLFAAACIIACNSQESNTIVKTDNSALKVQPAIFDKLIGTWQNEDGKSFERWTKNPDGTFRTVGFSINANDTSWNEQADIYQENDHWVFENTVKGQNDGKAVKFISSLLNETSVQFSNPAHDFPTDVNYTLVDLNTLNAFIVGKNKEEKDTIPFNFKRVELRIKLIGAYSIYKRQCSSCRQNVFLTSNDAKKLAPFIHPVDFATNRQRKFFSFNWIHSAVRIFLLYFVGAIFLRSSSQHFGSPVNSKSLSPFTIAV